MNFLESGHTHNDVDGGFGCLSGKLRVNDAWTKEEMEDMYRAACTNANNRDCTKSFVAKDIAEKTSRHEAVQLLSVPNFTAIYHHAVCTPALVCPLVCKIIIYAIMT